MRGNGGLAAHHHHPEILARGPRRTATAVNLLKEILRQNGGLNPKQATRKYTAPCPGCRGQGRWRKKYGFRTATSWQRRRVPGPVRRAALPCVFDRTARPRRAVRGCHLRQRPTRQFLCTLAGPAGHVLGLDIQQQAVDNTNARLATAGYVAQWGRCCTTTPRLAELVQPGTAGLPVRSQLRAGLPGAEHDVHSTADGSVPAPCVRRWRLCAPAACWPGAHSERSSVTPRSRPHWRFFKALPLTRYTVLVCEFANWAQTAPLPCLVIKK